MKCKSLKNLLQKKRGRKPKAEKDDSALPKEAMKPKPDGSVVLTLNLSEGFKQKLIEYAILKLLEERE